MGKLTYLNHMKACAEAAKSFTNGLVAKLAQTVTEAMQEMEDVKADKQNTKAITIPTTGWGIDENSEDYPSYCDIVVAGITAKDRVDIAIAPNSQAAAIACGMSPTNQTLAGEDPRMGEDRSGRRYFRGILAESGKGVTRRYGLWNRKCRSGSDR